MMLDLAMPRMDGMTLLAELHALHREPVTRTIVLTANGSIQKALQAVRLGAADFLEKPFTPEDVRLSVASVLSEAESQRKTNAQAYETILHAIREALREGALQLAEQQLRKASTLLEDDPAILNLAGVLQESHGRRACARRFYRRAALARGIAYQPACQNLRRLHEVETRGRTRRTIALGDETEVPGEFNGALGHHHLEQIRRLLER
jgi:CheY-like chemotaxis protein